MLTLFVFENVLTETTPGRVVIWENSLEEAQENAYGQFGIENFDTSLEEFLNREPGFRQPTIVCPLGI